MLGDLDIVDGFGHFSSSLEERSNEGLHRAGDIIRGDGLRMLRGYLLHLGIQRAQHLGGSIFKAWYENIAELFLERKTNGGRYGDGELFRQFLYVDAALGDPG